MKQATRLCCKPCSKLSLDLFVWDTFSAIKLVDAFLDGGQKFDPLSYLVQRNFIGQLADRFQDKSFLRHTPNMRPRSRRSKFETGIKLRRDLPSPNHGKAGRTSGQANGRELRRSRRPPAFARGSGTAGG